MKQVVKHLVTAVAGISMAAGFAFTASAQQATSLDDLLRIVQENRQSAQRIDQEREARFTSERANRQQLLQEAQQQYANEEQRGQQLQQQFAQNEIDLANKETELDNMVGTLGEIFGVIRGSASDAIGRIATSVISAEYPGREDVLTGLAQADELPQIGELEDLWIALLTEMRESGRVSRFQGEVTLLEGGTEVRDIVRIGPFNLISDGEYLLYNDQLGQIQPLGRQPAGHVLRTASNYEDTTSGFAGVYVDPSRGAILSLLTQRATLAERYHQGQTVGYAITVVMFIGLIIALYKLVTLTMAGAAIRSQLKNLDNPGNNPLGRILKVYQANKHVDVETLELKLDEAILREIPRIDSGISIIKVLAAVSPLMGLLGTVVGMIGTFQSITLFGTGDPRIMAGDISMALVTTAQGLISALPLIVAHAIVAGRAKTIVHILDEQAAGIIASHAEKGE